MTSVTYSNGVDTPVTVDLTYDGSGNPLTYYNGKNYTMTWRNGRELNTVTTGGKTYSYEYDVNSLRTSKVVDGVTHNYIYAGGKLLREQYGTTTLDFLYDVNGSPYILQYTNGSSTATYYYITNLQGDVVRIVDTAGATVAQYRYDAWGTLLAITDSTGAHISSSTHIANINPLRYRGYYYDTETKFYYLQSRYYDPEIGRFINADGYASTGQGFLGYNMFVYCNSNPVNFVDKSGNTAEAVQWWTGTMWWLCAADTVLPVGDVIYGVGILILGIYALDLESSTLVVTISTQYAKNDTSEKEDVTKGDPPTERDGYKAPKNGPRLGKTNDGQTGWVDKYGNIWVPAPTGSPAAHGGGHWDVQRGDGKGYTNVYPGGKTRPGKGKPAKIPSIVNCVL